MNKEEIPQIASPPKQQLLPLQGPIQNAIAPVVVEKENVTVENVVVSIVPDMDPSEDLNLMSLIADIQNNNDEDLVLAASQVEQQMSKENIKTSKSMAIIKKTSPPRPLATTFSNCTFGQVGNINIHIHKN